MPDIEFSNLIAAQTAFYGRGETRTLAFRKQQLKRLKKAIILRESDIINALREDLGKGSAESYLSEVGFVIREIDYLYSHLQGLMKPSRVPTAPAFLGGASMVVPEPLGRVLIISPWNYPVNLSLTPLAGAMAAGNCCVIKPSEKSPRTASLLEDIVSAVFEPEYAAVVNGGIETAQRMLDYPWDHIFFTGDSAVGRQIMEKASRFLTPVTLELGGKCPCIVADNRHMDVTARRIVWGKFLNAGQTCVAPDYVLAARSLKESLIKAMIKSVQDFYGPDPASCQNYPRIINTEQFDRITALLQGQTILYGGRIRREACYIGPTIVDEPSLKAPIMQEEIFGPVLPVLAYDHLDQAIAIINQRPKPLACYLFSSDPLDQRRVLAETSSGGVALNDTINHMTSNHLPFGGVGCSGLGRYHGDASFHVFSNRKSVLKNSLVFDWSLRYPPYNAGLHLFKQLMKLIK